MRFKRPLVVVSSAERTARLVFDANNAEEFDNRLSALGEMLKGFRVPGDRTQGTLQRLDAFLASRLSAEAMARVRPAIATLQRVTHIRNAGQHIGASTKAAAALPAFGLTVPIADHTTAWQAVHVHVVNALDAIRDEIRATV